MGDQSSPKNEGLALAAPAPFGLLHTGLVDFVIFSHQLLKPREDRHQLHRHAVEVAATIHSIEYISARRIVQSTLESSQHNDKALKVVHNVPDILGGILDSGYERLYLNRKLGSKNKKASDSASTADSFHCQRRLSAMDEARVSKG